jgi:diguanylate cyclase (GGDEF)-like protein
MISRRQSSGASASASLLSARRDALVLGILISAVCLLIWNGSTFFRDLSIAGAEFSGAIELASTALTLNVALVLFGWRRYVDLRQDSERLRETEQRALIAASTDAVTGLLNRKGFADRVATIARDLGGRSLGVISVQVNRLKLVSDRHGYEVGDSVRRAIAQALLAEAPADAVVGRLSGDEFAIALPVAENARSRVETLGDVVLRAITRPYELDGLLIELGAFAGLTITDSPGVRISDVLRRADIATDHARAGRSARPVWFDQGMERALIAQTELEQGIRYGLDHEQFVPYFEPQVDLATGVIIGFEVLARWQHPLSGIIGPDRFIHVAEEMNLIGRLSEQVFRAALLESRDWDPHIKISVNMSPAQLADGWLAERVLRLLTETGFPAERLVVEITETSLFADVEMARSIVSSLKNQGVRIALDDFGTGYSSLAHLRELPFDMIKIDRSFVTDIHDNPESAAIIRAVTTLASGLRVPVTAEGIECEAAHSAVLRLKCTFGQGWYFGKAMPADQAAQLLAPPTQSNEGSTPRSAAR